MQDFSFTQLNQPLSNDDQQVLSAGGGMATNLDFYSFDCQGAGPDNGQEVGDLGHSWNGISDGVSPTSTARQHQDSLFDASMMPSAPQQQQQQQQQQTSFDASMPPPPAPMMQQQQASAPYPYPITMIGTGMGRQIGLAVQTQGLPFRGLSDGGQYQQTTGGYPQGQPGGSPLGQHYHGGFPVQSPTQLNHTPSNERIPLPPQHNRSYSSASSPGGSQQGNGGEQAMVVQASGPMSSSISVPARPRPGRKPIPQEDAADRRRLQNRIAQRNFRDKRQQKLIETQQELQDQKAIWEGDNGKLRRDLDKAHSQYRQEIEKKDRRLDDVERQLQAERQRVEALERTVQELQSRLDMQSAQTKASIHNFRPSVSMSHAPSYTRPSEPTPPHENPISPSTSNYNDMETDFTSRFATSSSYNLRTTNSNDSQQMDYTYTQPSEDPCGFCTDSSNCLCASARDQPAKRVPEPSAPSATATGPGSCDMCRADPERARECRELAARSQMGTRPPTSQGSRTYGETEVTKRSLMPPPPPMRCGTLLDRFKEAGESPATVSSLFGGKFNAYPARTGGGYEIEERQAAEMLTALSRRSTGSTSSSMTDAAPSRNNSTA